MRVRVSTLVWIGVLLLLAVARFTLTRPPAPALKPAPPRVAEGPALMPPTPQTDEIWLGPDGLDAYGYPLRHVDEAGLQALVRAGELERAERFVAKLQAAFDRDFHTELWLSEALDAFHTADPKLSPLLDAWVARRPQSYAAIAARGAHRIATAWAQRGGDYARNTPAAQMQGFRETLDRASADLQQALALNPRFIGAQALLMEIAGASPASSPPEASILDSAERVCPQCISVRKVFLAYQTPLWGGSLEALDRQVADFTKDVRNPRVAMLAGYGDAVRCDLLRIQRDLEGALAACDRAVHASPDSPYCLFHRARVHLAMQNSALALADLDVAHRVVPYDRLVTERRVPLLMAVKRYREAVDDLLCARRVDPVDEGLVKLNTHTVSQLVYAGWEAGKRGDTATATSLFDMALELDPSNTDARARRLHAVSPTEAPTQIESLLARADNEPDNFELRRELDDLYFRQGRLDEIVAMWTGFLQSHPDHARAYFERAGTYHHRGEEALARADVAQACKLGLPDACRLAQRVGVGGNPSPP